MKEVWLIGPGNIGLHYVKVLQAMDVNLTVIGRSAKKDWPVPVYEHGLDNYILQFPDSNVEYAIVAVDEASAIHEVPEVVALCLNSPKRACPGSP